MMNELHTILFGASALCFALGSIDRIEVKGVNLVILAFGFASAGMAVLYTFL